MRTQEQHDRRGNRQQDEGQPVLVPEGEDDGDGQGAEQRPQLVERLVHPERPAVANLLRRMGQHHVPWWIPGRTPEPLEDDQHARELPAQGEGKQRHGGHLDDVAEDGDRPELTRPVAEPSGDQSEAVPEQLAEPGDGGHRDGACPEQGEVRPDDRPQALASEVREEAHDADGQDEPHGTAPRKT